MPRKKTNHSITQGDSPVKVHTSEYKLGELLQKAGTLPQLSGCYLMKNSRGEVIYVGKAKNLKNRVSSYFNKSQKGPKTQILVSHIKDFDFILTASDPESFVLENNLIKEYRPRYNIRMRDDKSYPYVRFDLNDVYPRIEYLRRPKRKKGVQLFGPFPVGSNVSQVIKTLTKALKLRDCTNHEFNSRKTPCLLYQMHQCSAPCVGYKGGKDYQAEVQMAINFFQGPRLANKTIDYLVTKMHDHAQKEEFEQAALLRDSLTELQIFLENSYKQNVELVEDKSIDTIAYYVGETEIDISIYMVRQGLLLGHKNFNFAIDDLIDDAQTEIIQYIIQYYSNSDDVLPDLIIADFENETIDLVKKSLDQMVEGKFHFKVQGRKTKYDSLLQSTVKHAQESQRVRLANEKSVYVGLNRLKELLKMKARPSILECYDVAIWQGKSPTASQIVFVDGQADKSAYRYYHLDERPEGNNDFAMLQEVFSRRIGHGNLPDVFIVDGGVGQVNSVCKILEELDIQVPVVGIAKARFLSKDINDEGKHSEERLIIPNRSNPYILKKCPSLMKIIVQMRDEAHRFSRKLHHKAENKRVFSSWIDQIRGINYETRKIIRAGLGHTPEELSQMTSSQLQNFFGIDLRSARILYKFLRKYEKKNSNSSHE